MTIEHELKTNGLAELDFAEMMSIEGGRFRLGFDHGFWLGLLTGIVLIALL